MNASDDPADLWPELDYDEISPTLDHLHRLAQVGAKYTLDAIYERSWGHIVLGVTPRGFATPILERDGVTFAIEFALLDARATIVASSGTASIALEPGSVAAFYATFVEAAARLGIGPPKTAIETEMADAKTFVADTQTRPFDPAVAKTIWRALASASAALRIYQAPYNGPRPPVGIMWGGFDLSATRYNGKPHAAPADRPIFMRNGMNSEEVAVGFSFGDDTTRTPAFYAYTAPAFDALTVADFGVPGAAWLPAAGLASLPWEAIRTNPRPRAAIVRFADTVYAVAVEHGGWPANMVGPREDGWYASRNAIA